MAKVTVTGGGNDQSGKQLGTVRIVDPNPEGTNVKHEDLMLYVKLKANTKSRSIITNVEEDTLIVENNIPIDYIEKSLDNFDLYETRGNIVIRKKFILYDFRSRKNIFTYK
jgi:hypothetical protein